MDVRACYCAVAIAYMCKTAAKKQGQELTDSIDVGKLTHFLLERIHTAQGGFGFEGNPESHSGLTYCAVASLKMLGVTLDRDVWAGIVDYCAFRQTGGF